MADVLGAKIGKVHLIQEIKNNEYISPNAYSNIRSFSDNSSQTGYGNIKISGMVAVEFELK